MTALLQSLTGLLSDRQYGHGLKSALTEGKAAKLFIQYIFESVFLTKNWVFTIGENRIFGNFKA
jgi:hypothetical protein